MVCVVVLCKMSLPPLSSVLFKSVLSSEIHQFWLSSCRRTLCLSVIPKPRVEISRCCKSTCRNKWLPDKCSWTQTFCVMAPGLYSTFALHKSIKMDQCESCRTYTPILNSSIRNKSSVRKTKIKKQTNILKERFEEIIMVCILIIGDFNYAEFPLNINV